MLSIDAMRVDSNRGILESNDLQIQIESEQCVQDAVDLIKSDYVS